MIKLYLKIVRDFKGMTKVTRDVCYACDRPSSSREHVPPKCLFPTQLGKDLRKNLITVPSCTEHNGKKSVDDEFLLASLAGIIGCNNIGMLHGATKVNRAIRRSGGRLLSKVLKDYEIRSHQFDEENTYDIAWGKPNVNRLSNCFSLIGKGLYFHKFGYRFIGKVICEIIYVPLNNRGRMGYRSFVVEEMRKEIAKTKLEGENPEVFQWVIGPVDATGACCAQLVFYGNLTVYLAFIPKIFEAKSSSSLYEMAQSIDKPVFIKSNGKQFRIN